MSLPLEDYALIGDTHTAALVSRGGSIDWLCLPRFDSGACFASLVGDESHGRWLLSPTDRFKTRRRYRPETLVLDSEHAVDSGAVRVTDFMTPRRAQARVVRVVEGLRGSVAMRSDLNLRFDYGLAVPWLRPGRRLVTAVAGPDAVDLRTDAPIDVTTGSVTSEFVVRAGERVTFVLTWHRSHEPAPPAIDPWAALRSTMRFWTEWAARCEYRGEWRDAVVRSLITLKALTYRPTGGIVAAPTTSLPEGIGGARNWDYRFCWLRDATFTLYSLLMAGYDDEAEAWREWLLRAVAGDPRDLRIMYGIGGERRFPELELDWLPGYEGSLPVRVGNDASRQFQLDVYGEVLDLLHQASREGLPHEAAAWDMELRMLDVLESAWREPDEGIWEVRGGRQHFVHSKVMAWVGVDRAIRDVELWGFEGPLDRWRALRDEIHAEVCRDGFDEGLNAFTQSYGSTSLDAAVLMMPLVGFLPVTDARVAGTIDAIQARLMSDGFVRRYDTGTHIDGLPGAEGAFIPCSCWLADCLALQGRDAEARELFERVLSVRTDCGLLSEEYDTVRNRLVGNFPQAFSHVSLIGTARNLSRREVGPAERRRRPARLGQALRGRKVPGGGSR
ncbi:MAG TPA: glycoside hydrolase family 15 protein [Actinomycetota bacterium]|nr:glycoside hydrolase family 15 protein [Actinomycetota bacterium]